MPGSVPSPSQGSSHTSWCGTGSHWLFLAAGEAREGTKGWGMVNVLELA